MTTLVSLLNHNDARRLVAGLGLLFCAVMATAADVKHVQVYHEAGKYAGWPANGGIWSWSNEILVGFHSGFYAQTGATAQTTSAEGDAQAEDGVAAGEALPTDTTRPQVDLLARSRDGGLTWKIEEPNKDGYLVGFALPPGGSLEEVTARAKQPTGGVDFTHPDFAMTLRKVEDSDIGPSFFHYSYDRGHTWEGPFRLPNFSTPGLLARTSYLVEGKDRCAIFVTAAKPDHSNGRSLMARTEDGGKTWNFVSWMVPELNAGAGIFAIMPTVVRLGDRELFSVIRFRDGERRWLAAYRSLDDGQTWKKENDPVPSTGGGNPGSLVDLGGNRLALTYGNRVMPSRICARLSEDGGRTWGAEIVLRADGSLRPVGYTQSVERPDGHIVTVYYFADQKTGPEQYIGATIWNPADFRQKQ